MSAPGPVGHQARCFGGLLEILKGEAAKDYSVNCESDYYKMIRVYAQPTETNERVAHIDAANTTARVTLADGATFSVVEDEADARLRRELQEVAEVGGATSRRLLLSEDEMQSHHRRLRGFLRRLISGGSFTTFPPGGFITGGSGNHYGRWSSGG